MVNHGNGRVKQQDTKLPALKHGFSLSNELKRSNSEEKLLLCCSAQELIHHVRLQNQPRQELRMKL